MNNRKCINCGSETTRLIEGKRLVWYRFEGNFRCHKCQSRLVYGPKAHAKRTKEDIHKYNDRKLYFIDKRIYVKENPRKGTCLNCGFKGRTHIHHVQYDPKDPLANTIELCVSCHAKITVDRPLIKNQYGIFPRRNRVG